MRRRRFSKLVALISLGLIQGAVAAAPSQAAEQAVGLTAQSPSQIVSFGVDAPGTVSGPTAITFQATATDTNLVGIDYRPRTESLFGIGAGGTLYALSPPASAGANWTAIQVNPTPLVSPFMGAGYFGFDFNPTVDRLRVVDDAATPFDNNFRFVPDNGAQVDGDSATPGVQADGDLDYPAGDPNAAATPKVSAAGYTNSFDGATATTLFDIDYGLDILATQSPPNNGQLNTVGSLGFNTTGNVGLDIASGSGTAYAALELASATGNSTLYTVDLTSGAASPVGAIGAGQPLESVAVAPASQISFANATVSVREGDGMANVTVVRTGAISRQVTVNYATSPGTAGSADYTDVSGTLTFAPNQTSGTIQVPVAQDKIREHTETVNLTLSAPGPNAILGTPSTALLKIIDKRPGHRRAHRKRIRKHNEGNRSRTTVRYRLSR